MGVGRGRGEDRRTVPTHSVKALGKRKINSPPGEEKSKDGRNL